MTSSRRGAGQQGRARHAARPQRTGRRSKVKLLSIEELVGGIPSAGLTELFAFWSKGRAGAAPKDGAELRLQVCDWMQEPRWLEERVGALDGRQRCVLECLLVAPEFCASYQQLSNDGKLTALSAYDLEDCLTRLQRRGLVYETGNPRFEEYGERVYALPADLAQCLQGERRRRNRGLFDALTLRGHLDRIYGQEGSKPGRGSSPQHLRRMYKMYASETASVARIERLPDGIRHLVQKAVLEFGGVLPRGLFERMKTQLPHWNGRRWRKILEESLVGTVGELELSRYGIRHDDQTLIVFNEVALAWLRRVAVPGDPDRPHEELSLGVDLVANLSRFLGFILEHDVRFTVRGEIFKTTENKIIQYLIPNPGRELSRQEVLRFLYRFTRSANLIDRTGERTLSVTSTGREWSQRPLAEKLNLLHGFSMEERGLGGDYFHQVQMRQMFMRLLKRVEPGTWYDLMYLPFLARNAYLANLDELGVEDFFAERSRSARYAISEDPQKLAWNLVSWVRRRLYLLGVIDLGYDIRKRPVAMRLTRSGARLLGVTEHPADARPPVGTLVVTPDFEIVLFPTGDDAELAHDLDRFCVRDKKSDLLHFKISDDSVRRALVEGMPLERILSTLELHSRTPVPQNVSFSIRDWALRAGLMRLDDGLVIHCADIDTMRRFQQDPGVRNYVDRVLGEERLQLKAEITPQRMRALLRELGYLVELS